MPYFTFTDASNETFVIRLTDPDQVAHARGLLNGTVDHNWHVGGTITKAPAEHNIGWSYSIPTNKVEFFEASIEVADSNMRYIESHLGAVGGHLLPGRVWLGWSSKLTGELEGRFGTCYGDILHGETDTNDLMLGRGGGDIMLAYGGDDHLSGGNGNDILQGGRGNDKLGGGCGNDILQGEWGNDLLDGGQGDDILSGGAGRDVFLAPCVDSCDTDVITDFCGNGARLGDQIRFDRDWLREIGDANHDGKLNRLDIVAAFEKCDGDLVLKVDDATIILQGEAGTILHANDFLIG